MTLGFLIAWIIIWLAFAGLSWTGKEMSFLFCLVMSFLMWLATTLVITVVIWLSFLPIWSYRIF